MDHSLLRGPARQTSETASRNEGADAISARQENAIDLGLYRTLGNGALRSTAQHAQKIVEGVGCHHQ